MLPILPMVIVYLALPDPRHQRVVQRVALVEHLLDRRHRHALGPLREQPVGEVGRLAPRAMQGDETLRIGVLAERRDGLEGGAGLFDHEMGWSRQASAN